MPLEVLAPDPKDEEKRRKLREARAKKRQAVKELYGEA